MGKLGSAIRDNPLIRYRVMLVLAALGAGTGLVLTSRFLPAGFQRFALGVAIGLLFIFVGEVINWVFKQTFIASLIILPMTGAALTSIFHSDAYLIAGEASGLLLFFALVFALPLRRPSKTNQQQQRMRMAALEEPSPNTMILPPPVEGTRWRKSR